MGVLVSFPSFHIFVGYFWIFFVYLTIFIWGNFSGVLQFLHLLLIRVFIQSYSILFYLPFILFHLFFFCSSLAHVQFILFYFIYLLFILFFQLMKPIQHFQIYIFLFIHLIIYLFIYLLTFSLNYLFTHLDPRVQAIAEIN